MRSLRFDHCIRLCALLFIVLAPGLHAQPDLDFKYVLSDWPTIKLVVKATCNGQTVSPLNKQNITIKENGVEVQDFTIQSCPVPNMNCPMSVGIMIDGTASTAGLPNAWQKAAAHAFVSTMDGQIDNASIMWFADDIHRQTLMLTDTNSLHTAIEMLPSQGGADNWYALDSACAWTVQTATNNCKAVIYITDGTCNHASHTGEWAGIAAANDVRVFTIALGLGSIPHWSQLFSDFTSGKAYTAATPDSLPGIFLDIANRIRDGYEECRLTYQSECADGSLREVEITVSDICGQTLTETLMYRAPRDTSTFSVVSLALGSTDAQATQQVTLPLTLQSTLPPGTVLNPFRFQIDFNEDELTFQGLETPPGSFLESASVTTSILSHPDPYGGPDIVTGVEVEVADRITVSGSGLMAGLVFEVADLQDATVCAAPLGGWLFEAGCLKPAVSGGQITVTPRIPEMQCAMQAPDKLNWELASHGYVPSTVVVHAEALNSGTRAAENAQFTVSFDANDFLLGAAHTLSQPGSPLDAPPGGSSIAEWNLIPKSRLTGDTVTVTVDITFDNHAPIQCSRRIWIPAIGPLLECSIQNVTIVADQDQQRYDPMPFPVVVDISNRGGQDADPVSATITLPQGLEFAHPDGPGRETKTLIPAALGPNQQTSVQWLLTHPPTDVEKVYKVQVWTKAGNADSTMCEIQITIPRLEAPNLTAACTVPDSLLVNHAVGEGGPSQEVYLGNPFDVTLSAANLGPMTAENVTAFLYLPDGVALDPASQPLRQSFGDLGHWSPGDPVPELTWTVRYTKSYKYNTELQFAWAVGGVAEVGQKPLDSLHTNCTVQVEGLPQSLKCLLHAPAALALDSTETDLTPNPFTVTYFLENTGKQDAYVESVELLLPAGDLATDVSVPGNEAMRLLQTVIEPDSTVIIEWTVKAERRVNARDVDIRAVALDDEANPVECSSSMHIPAIKSALICNMEIDPPILRWDEQEQRYADSTFTATVTITNTGGFPQTDVEVGMLEINSPSGMNLVKLDPAYPNTDPVVFPVLFPSISKTATWHFRINPNNSGSMDIVELAVAYGSNEIPRVVNACNALVQIEPQRAPTVVCSIDVPDTIRLNAARTGLELNPFSVVFEVTNVGNGGCDIRSFDCIFPHSSISLSSISSNQQTRLGSWTVLPGDTETQTWTFDVVESSRNRIVPIQIVATDTLGNAIICEDTVYIEASLGDVKCNLVLSKDSLAIDRESGLYTDPSFEMTATMMNIGYMILDSVHVEAAKYDPQGYLEFDPTYSDNSNPKTIVQFPLWQDYYLAWGFRLAKPNETDSAEVIDICVNYSSARLPSVEWVCCTQVYIEPAAITATEEVPGAQDFALGVSYPNPFTSSTEVSYTMARESHVSIAVYSVLGREVATLVNQRMSAGKHTARFDARGLPGGVYILRMNTGGFAATRTVYLRR